MDRYQADATSREATELVDLRWDQIDFGSATSLAAGDVSGARRFCRFDRDIAMKPLNAGLARARAQGDGVRPQAVKTSGRGRRSRAEG
jgi:hypothetical protein